MVKIINPFRGQDPIASAFGSLGGAFKRGQSERLEAARAYAQEMENTEKMNLMRRIDAMGGLQNLGADGMAQAMALAAGIDHADYGGYGLLGAATEFGAKDRRTQDFQVGTGQPYSNTYDAFETDLAAENARAAAVREQQAKEAADRLAQQVIDDAQDSLDARYGVDVASKDRRYNVDQDILQDQREFGVTSAEARRAHDLEQTARLDNEQGEMDRWLMEPKAAMIEGPAGPPIMGPGGVPIASGAAGEARPGFVRQGELATRPGVAPILSETEVKGGFGAANFGRMGDLPVNEQSYLGADQSAEKTHPTWMYVAGGKSFMVNDLSIAQGRDVQGNPVPPGGSKVSLQPTDAEGAGLTNATRSALQKSSISHQQFNALVDYTERLVRSSPPENFGIVGLAKDYGQNAAIAADNLAQGLGFQGGTEAINEIQRAAAANGVTPGIMSSIFQFDPKLGALQTTYGLLVYATASALAGQDGRSASDPDIIRAKEIVGNPHSVFSNQQLMLTKLQTLRELGLMQEGVNERMLGGGMGGPAAPKRRTATDGAGNKVEYDPVAKAWVPVRVP